MATSIKNSKTKNFKDVDDAFKMLMKQNTVKSVSAGMQATCKIIIDKINNGYTVEQIKKYCENCIKES